MNRMSESELKAQIAALRAITETELRNLGARLLAVEATQKELVHVATQGKAALRVFLWLGGVVTAVLTAWATLWKDLLGK